MDVLAQVNITAHGGARGRRPRLFTSACARPHGFGKGLTSIVCAARPSRPRAARTVLTAHALYCVNALRVTVFHYQNVHTSYFHSLHWNSYY
ncbi:hypothetical protein EVAR_61087_1 [Eumeta japonica]|uniref:Uncharacterized protein n=1 Tax=Eumeta variegata TaxID=151549 RepID=A0A4C1YRV7_EUMVA|nr:hypothetical protein EVAR_61087_1 [Eumeta japonica]